MISCYHLTIEGHAEGPNLLEEVSFEFDEGDWVEFVGPSGAGKSLLFSVLTMENQPAEGRLVVAGRNLDRLDASGIAEVRRELGTCRQTPVLLEERNVIQNLVLPLAVRGETRDAAGVAEDLLETCEMGELRDVRVCELAAGHRRLVALLRALIGEPRLVAVDGGAELLGGGLREVARRVLRESYGDGTSIVLFGRSPSEMAPDGAVFFEVSNGSVERVDEGAA